MSDDLTPPCPQCAIAPHDEPDLPHVHLTDFGYVLYTPTHRMRDYIEEIREFERAAGRRQAADAIRAALAEDLADSDVSSGEAIWEQHGYRDGLRTAADLAAPAEPAEEAP